MARTLLLRNGMSPILPALLLMLACAAPSGDKPSGNPQSGDKMDAKTLFVRDVDVELTNQPTMLTLDLGDAREKALEIARDPKRHLALRIERISATKPPGVNFDVRVQGSDEPVGVLALFGIEESNGTFIASFPIDSAVPRALAGDRRELRVIFVPQAITDANGRPQPVQLEGKVRFARIRVAED